MTCRELHELLMSYLDGELPAERRSAFESHLSGCPSCVAYVETYRKAPEAARRALAPGNEKEREAPEGLVRAILAARAGKQQSGKAAEQQRRGE